MSASKLSSLIVDLQLQSAQLRKGLDDVNSKLDTFAKKAGETSKTLNQVFSFEMAERAIGGLAEFVLHGAEAADHMGKLAQSIGMPVEELNRLSYAATFSGVSTDQLGVALTKLSQQMSGAASGSKEQVALFQALGISVKDSSGHLKKSGDVMGEVAQLFSGLEDGVAKTTLATDLFGKAGADMIPLLNEGAAGLEEMGNEADRLFPITAAGAAASEKFNDSLDRMKVLGTGVATRVAQQLAPALSGLTDQIIDNLTKTDALDTATAGLTLTIKGLVTGGVIVAGVMRGLGQVLAGLASMLTNMVEGEFDKAQEAFNGLYDSLGDVIDETKAQVNALWDDTAGAAEESTERTKKSADQIVISIKKIEDANTAAAAAAKKHTEELKRNIEAQAKGLAELETLFARLDRQGGQRRSDFASAGQSPLERQRADAAGFSGHDDAITRWLQALKDEAFQREMATELRREHDTDGADAAERAANAAKALAEQADRAADAFEQMHNAAVQAQQAMLGKALGPGISGLISAGQQGAQAGAMAGPEGAAIGAAVGLSLQLLTQSRQFSELMSSVDEALQAFADMLGSVLEPLIPVVDALVPLFVILKGPLELLGEVVKAISFLILGVVRGVAGIWNGLSDLLDHIGLGFGHIDTSSMDNALLDLMGGAHEAADATQQLGAAARTATEEILNAPSGFRVAAYRYMAQNPEGEPTPAGGGSASGGGGGDVGDVGGGIDVGDMDPGDGPVGKPPRGRGRVQVRLFVDRNLNLAASVEQEKYRSNGSKYVEGPVSG